MAGWDAEAVAKAKAAEARMAGPEQRKMMTDGFIRIFEEADLDKDTYLDMSEYFTFCAKMKAFTEEKELPVVEQSNAYN